MDENKAPSFKRMRILPETGMFHGQPKLWWKGLAVKETLLYRKNKMEQANFHKVALKEVMKALGHNNCKYLSHVKSRDGISFRAKVKIKGVWKTINVDTELKDADNLRPEDYKSLKDVLENAIRI